MAVIKHYTLIKFQPVFKYMALAFIILILHN